MQYTTKDIVLRARQLADLENSDFISYNENIQLLNETYQQVYQKLIDRGDKAFLKKIVSPRLDTLNELPENAIAIILPPDFYQLASVNHSRSHLPILRRSKNQDPQTLSYEILNDELVIYQGANLQLLDIRYYPTPCSLYLHRDPVPFILDIPEGAELKDIRFHQALWVKINEDDNTKVDVTIYDINEQQSVTDTITGYHDNFYYLEAPNAYTVMSPSNAIEVHILGQTTVGFSGLRFVCTDGSTRFVAPDTEESGIWTCWVSEFRPGYNAPVGIGQAQFSDDFLHDNSVGFYDGEHYLLVHQFTVPGSYAEYWFGYIDDEDAFIGLYPVFGDLGLMSADGGNIIYQDDQGLKFNGELVPFPGYQVLGIDEVNYDSGLGVVLKDRFGNYFLGSPFPDTLLHFPQSFYYTYLAYFLAVAYGIKQGKDVTALTAQLQTTENTFYDTLERDDNAPVRIANVYRR